MTPAELERIAYLMEECGEVIHVCGKILRHGYDACHPDGGPDNRALLENELVDVQTAIWLMDKAGDVEKMPVSKNRINKYMHYQDYLKS